MHGLSMVTQGFITPVQISSTGGSGGGGIYRVEEEMPKPLIQVMDVSIDGKKNVPLTNENIKVKTVKIIVD
jgi:hypothetical protein